LKRRDLIAHIEAEGCVFVREGANHSIYQNPNTNPVLQSSVPRHREIDDFLAKKICKDLGIDPP